MAAGERLSAANLHAGQRRPQDESSAMRTGSSITLLALPHGLRGSGTAAIVSDA